MSFTYLSKVSAITVLAISIAACSSGGSHSTQAVNLPLSPEQAAAEKAAAEKAAAEKAAAEKAAAEKAAAEKAAAEKAAAEKAAAEKDAADKAAADKAAADKAAADKAAAEKAAADKAAADKAAADKAAEEKAAAEKAAADKAAAEKAAAEKAAAEKAAAEKAAADKVEAERLQKIEANRLVLLDKAQKAGLEGQQAEDYADAYKQSEGTVAQTALDTIIANNAKAALVAEIAAAKGISDDAYPVGEVIARNGGSASSTRNAYTQESSSKSVVYNQNYSVVLGSYTRTLAYNNQTGYIFSDNTDSTLEARGLKTLADAIPTLGNATYSGKAFNNMAAGTLNYTVNFSGRTGSGSIKGLGDEIILQQGSISGNGITSTAQQLHNEGTYSLGFYGKKAEEIAGKVGFGGNDTIGFGGTRGEISK